MRTRQHAVHVQESKIAQHQSDYDTLHARGLEKRMSYDSMSVTLKANTDRIEKLRTEDLLRYMAEHGYPIAEVPHAAITLSGDHQVGALPRTPHPCPRPRPRDRFHPFPGPLSHSPSSFLCPHRSLLLPLVPYPIPFFAPPVPRALRRRVDLWQH